MKAAFDQIADWYENEFLAGFGAGDPLGIDRAVRDLLGPGNGACLEVGCGTGIHADQIRSLGRTPLGVDLSSGMLGYAASRLPVAQADAVLLPISDRSVPAALIAMAHTDMPDYPAVVHEVARVLQPGGVFVHIGVHPCFGGAFADHSNRRAVVIRPGYLDTYWSRQSWTDRGVRDKVGAVHRPLPELLHAFLDAGLTLERFTEGGSPTPIVLAIRARKVAPASR